MIKSKGLKQGDTISMVSLSAAHSYLFPKRIERAARFFRDRGYEVKFGKTLCLNQDTKSGTPQERAEDLHSQFLDDKVAAIISASGGLFCNELLEHLDYSMISKNPKIFCGYSDNTVISAAILKYSNLVSFYGPCVVPEFGEYPNPFQDTAENFFNAVNGRLGEVKNTQGQTEEFVDWFADDCVKRELRPSEPYEWISNGRTSGKLVGGCSLSLSQLAGTKYDFDYKDNLLFLEIPEGDIMGRGVSPARVDSFITDLQLSRRLERVSGLIVGRLFRQSEEDKNRIKDSFYAKTKNLGIPVLYGPAITHGEPKVTIPFGVQASLDSSKNEFRILEQGVVI